MSDAIPEAARGGRWRVIIDGPHDPGFNMALDLAILGSVVRGEAPPTLRFYGWDRRAVSLGYHQDAQRVLDMEAVRAHGFAVVRRPTGGRAVLHGDDLTYSVALPASVPWATSVTHAYCVISEALRAGFLAAGLDVELARGHLGALGPGPLPCFASTARYELVWRGRKLVGSAQRRMRGGVLQQGSIPLRRGSVSPEDLVPKGQCRSAKDRWVTVEEAMGTFVEGSSLARSLAEGFTLRLGVCLDLTGPTPREVAEAREAAW